MEGPLRKTSSFIASPPPYIPFALAFFFSLAQPGKKQKTKRGREMLTEEAKKKKNKRGETGRKKKKRTGSSLLTLAHLSFSTIETYVFETLNSL